MSRKISNLKGHGYGRWTVLSKSPIRKAGNVSWNCYCDPERGGCGFYTPLDSPINGTDLRSGRSLSCGCLRKDKVSDKDRNAAVFNWIAYGVPQNKVAEKFSLSRQRVHQIYHREKENHEGVSI